jgi:transcriptional regulator with XRE-family HTH domain
MKPNPPRTYEVTQTQFSGARLEAIRTARGWSRADLARSLRVTSQHIYHIEQEGGHPSLRLLHGLGRVLNVDVRQLFVPKEDR